MALNVKVLLDPKFYYQKLRELATKSKENFSKIGSDIGKIFTSARDQIRGSDISVKDFASQIVLAGGAFELIKKGAETAFRFIDMGMKNAKARFLDFFNSIGDAANTYAAYEKQQQQLSSDNTSALEKLADLQLSGPELNYTQQEEQRQAIEMLRKSYRGLKVDIDGATGKIKNFEEIQQKILSSDQKKELTLIQQQIKMLEKQNNLGQKTVQYTGGLFSEYWEKLKETYDWGAAQEIGGARKANVDKLMELRWREFNLKYKDRAGDASKMFAAKKKDAALQNARAAFFKKEAEQNEQQRFLLNAPEVPGVSDQSYRVTGRVNAPEVPGVSDQSYRVTGRVNAPEVPGVSDQSYRVTGKLFDLAQERKQVLSLINELKSKKITLTVEEATSVVRQRRNTASMLHYQEQMGALTEQLQIQTLLNRGMDESARRQQIFNELKRQGLEYDQESVDKILELNGRLASMRLQAAQKKEVESLYSKALRVMGRTKEADEHDALKRARDQKGAELTEEEKASTLKLLALTSQVEEVRRNNKMDFSIKTNALTSRGGFQGGAVVSDSDKYNRSIASSGKKQTELLNDIKRTLAKLMEE